MPTKAGASYFGFPDALLLALMLAMAFTGYLLPWDQKAYFATTVGTNMAADVPFIGTWLKRFMRGGNEMGTLTISRFFVAHVFLLPAALIGFVAMHVYLFRKAGAAGPPSADPIKPQLPTQRFYPRQVVMDTVVALVMILILGGLAHFAPFELGPRANPADTQYIPRPEWYYLPIFQWLKYWRGPIRNLWHRHYSRDHRAAFGVRSVHRSPPGTEAVAQADRRRRFSFHSRVLCRHGPDECARRSA